MKRSELLKQGQKEKETINVDNIIKKDQRFIDKKRLDLEGQLDETEEAIEEYLKNPELIINNEFLSLVEKKGKLEWQLGLLEEIEQYIQ